MENYNIMTSLVSPEGLKSGVKFHYGYPEDTNRFRSHTG